jgi:hypothetical protein
MTVDPAAIIGALAVLITAITGLIVAVRGVRREVAEVHKIVNSRTDDQLERIDQLTQVITRAVPGISLPPTKPVADST